MSSLNVIIHELKHESLISSEIAESLQSIGGSVEKLFERVGKKSKAKKINAKVTHYCEILRSFAITLHFYSPKAYNYIRKTFKNCLPNERTLQKWFQNIGSKPGFSNDSFTALE